MINQLSKNVHEIRCGKEIKTLHCSDVHFDSTKCDRELFKSHLDEIKKVNGKVLIFGDLFDLMQGRFDPRRSYTDIRPEYRGKENYFDVVIDDAYEFLLPYVDNILFLSYGNHCTSVVKNTNMDPLQRLIRSLKQKNPDIGLGEYQGFLIWRFHLPNDSEERGSRYKSITAYHHGSGGNAKRSKGVLENQIDGFAYPDADLIVKGHNHHKHFDPSNTRVKLNERNGEIIYDSQKVLRLGTYRQHDGGFGWSIEKGFLPPGMGGWFVDYEMRMSESKTWIDINVTEAK